MAEQTTGTFTIVICWNRDSNNIDTTTYTTSPASLNYTATVAGEYSVRIFYTQTKPIVYSLTTTANGVTLTHNNVAIAYHSNKGVYLFNITQPCTQATI